MATMIRPTARALFPFLYLFGLKSKLGHDGLGILVQTHLSNNRATMKTATPFLLLALLALCLNQSPAAIAPVNAQEKQVTRGPGGRILTNTGVWSPDGQWIVYDTRSDPAGDVFDGSTIETVNITTGETRVIYRSQNGARCGASSFNPRSGDVVIMTGPENPTTDWQYGFWHRQGVIALHDGVATPGKYRPVSLDARNLDPPFTPGALRGGTHLHVWDAAGDWIALTYEDHLLAQFKEADPGRDLNARNVGVSVPGHFVHVPVGHPRNQDGEYFTVLVTHTVANPRPGSDEIAKAAEEAWVGTNGYVRPDGTRQHRALAFQGRITPLGAAPGQTNLEVFIVDLPEDVTLPGAGPLAGTSDRMPYPPKGAVQRRLTHTTDRPFPGLQGPRHWLRSSPDGSRIAFLMKDAAGVAQIWTISPNGGEPRQLTSNPSPVAGTFTWSPDGRWIAHVMDNSVCVTETDTGRTVRLTLRSPDATAPRPEACVFSPEGRHIAFIRRLPSPDQPANQICVLTLDLPRGH